MQSSQPQQPPHEIPTRSRYVREVPQFSGHTQDIPRLRLHSSRGPLIAQQTSYRDSLFKRKRDSHCMRVNSET